MKTPFSSPLPTGCRRLSLSGRFQFPGDLPPNLRLLPAPTAASAPSSLWTPKTSDADDPRSWGLSPAYTSQPSWATSSTPAAPVSSPYQSWLLP